MDINSPSQVPKNYTSINWEQVGGKWVTNWATGSAVGNKRIEVSSSGSQYVTKLRLNVSGGVELPANISMAAFRPCPAG